METITQCPLCFGGNFRTILSAEDYTVSLDHFTIQACEACNFHITSPRPHQEEIGSYYQSASYISHAAKPITIKDHIYHFVRKRAIRGKHKLVSSYQSRGGVLDLGCGTGDFLAYMAQQGYEATGVEISSQARAVAQAKGLRVEPDLNELPVTATFDLVTLWHVLEHLPDPRKALNEIHSRLAPGAHVVIAVPNRTSWDAKFYGDVWAAWDVPRHLSHFCREDLTKLLEDTGFVVRQFRNMWYDAPYVSMLSEQYRGAPATLAFMKGGLIGLCSNLIAFSGKCPASSILVVAQKPNSPDKAQNP